MIINNLLKTIITEDFCVDYGNDFYCYYQLINKDLAWSYFKFKDTNLKLKYCSNIDEFTNKCWFDIDYDLLPKLTLDEILNFNQFENLYYFGGGYDGLTKRPDGKIISVPIYFDDITCKNALNIETSEEECEKILESLIYGDFLEKSIYYIPHYNQDDELSEHFTIKFKVKLKQEIFDIFYNQHNPKYFREHSTMREIFKYLKTNKIKINELN
jgi:hypothetical protein